MRRRKSMICLLLAAVFCLFAAIGCATTLMLPTNLKVIKEEAFCGDMSFDEIILPEGLERIESRAFAGSSVSRINLPDSIIWIANDALDHCDVELSVIKDSYAYHWAVENGFITLSDEDETPVSSFEYTIKNEMVTINRYIGEETEVIIPKVIENYPVTCIGRSAFRDCSALTSITLPKTVTSIMEYAFYGCSSLIGIKIPDGVTRLEYGTFGECSSLSSIEIPNSVTDISWQVFSGCNNLKKVTMPEWIVGELSYYFGENIEEVVILDGAAEIGDYKFRDYVNLKNITIPYGVTKIGLCAFYGCSNLMSINIPDTVISIGKSAFEGCSSLTAIRIPSSVTNIQDSTFEDCKSIRSINIPDNVTDIGRRAFYGCSNLTSIKLPDGLTSMGEYAFSGCSSLESIEIPHKVIAIESNTFNECSSLINITIPDSVTEIKKYAFRDCSYLTSINIPNGITSLENGIFDGCSSLTNIVIPDKVTSIGSWAFSDCSSLTNINIPAGVISIADCMFTGCSSLTNIVIPDKVTSIGSLAFSGCSSLVSINIPNTLTSIGEYAFSGCNNLESVEIPDGVVKIDDGTFKQCSSITNIEIPSSVTSIGEQAFDYCTSLTCITIPESVTSIGKWAFYKCSSMTSARILNHTVSIGECAFDYCSNLKTVTIPGWIVATKEGDWGRHSTFVRYFGPDIEEIVLLEGATVIEEYTFKGCSSLKSISIPDSVTSIGEYAFYDCSSLTSIVIPENMTSIGAVAFSGCSSLSSIKIPDSATNISDSAFSDCNSIKKVTIYHSNQASSTDSFAPYLGTNIEEVMILDGVTALGDAIFANCSKLTSIDIPNSMIRIGEYAFQNCSGLTSIDIPDGITQIGEGAFQGCSSLTSINIPQNMTSIKDDTYENCSSLTAITIPSGITSIGAGAFEHCGSLTSIEIPKSVSSIGIGAFASCSNLKKITMSNLDAANLNNDYYSNTFSDYFGDDIEEVILLDGSTAIGDYVFADYSSLIHIEIPDSITKIGTGAFRNCSGLTGITIPGSVMDIEDYAFMDCSNLLRATIKNGVTSIGRDAFINCSSLSAVTIPGSVKSIGDRAFANCSKLAKVTVQDGAMTIGRYAFSACSSLSEIIMPQSMTSIGDYALSGCSSLASILIPKKVESIGSYAFSDCRGLTSVKIPDSVTSIKNGAFSGCAGLISIRLSDNISLIDNYTFSGCSSLKNVIIPNSVTWIGSFAFENCSRLKSISIPFSVTNIGNKAFSNCSNLRKVTTSDQFVSISKQPYYNQRNFIDFFGEDIEEVIILSGSKTIDGSPFRSCRNLKRIVIPDSVTYIDSAAFPTYAANLTVYCNTGSYASNYASQHGIKCSAEPFPETSSENPIVNVITEDEKGNPITDAQVTLYLENGDFVKRVQTDSDGVCSFDDLLDGEQYTIQIQKENHIFKETEKHFVVFSGQELDLTVIGVQSGLHHMNLIAPEKGARISESNVRVQFNRVWNTESYVLSLRDLSDVQNDSNGKLIYDHMEISQEGYTLSGLTGGHTYRVAVGAVPVGSTAYSDDVKWAEAEFYIISDHEPRIISFTMPQEPVYAGFPVTFEIEAADAQTVTLCVDDVLYDSVDVVSGKAQLTRVFTLAGDRQISFWANDEGKQSGQSDIRTLTVSAKDYLATPEIHHVEDTRLGNTMTVSWEKVLNAQEYVVYLYDPQGNTVLSQKTSEVFCEFASEVFKSAGQYTINVLAIAEGYSQSENGIFVSVYDFDSYEAWLNCETAVVYADQNLNEGTMFVNSKDSLTVLDILGNVAQICFADINSGKERIGYIQASLLSDTQFVMLSKIQCWYKRVNPKDPNSQITATVWATQDISTVEILMPNGERQTSVWTGTVSSAPHMMRYLASLPAVTETTTFTIEGYNNNHELVKTANLVIPPVVLELETLATPILPDYVPLTIGKEAALSWIGVANAQQYLVQISYQNAVVFEENVSAKIGTKVTVDASVFSNVGSYQLTVTALAEGYKPSSASKIFTVGNDTYLWPQKETIIVKKGRDSFTLDYQQMLSVMEREDTSYSVSFTCDGKLYEGWRAEATDVGTEKYVPDDMPMFDSTYGTKGVWVTSPAHRYKYFERETITIKVACNLVTESVELWANGVKLHDFRQSSASALYGKRYFELTFTLGKGAPKYMVKAIGTNSLEAEIDYEPLVEHRHSVVYDALSTVISRISDNGVTLSKGFCTDCGENLDGKTLSIESVFDNGVKKSSSGLIIEVPLTNDALQIDVSNNLHIKETLQISSGSIFCGGTMNIDAPVHARNITCKVLKVNKNGTLKMTQPDRVTTEKFEFASNTNHSTLLTGGVLTISGDVGIKNSNFRAGSSHETVFTANWHGITNSSSDTMFGIVIVHGNLTNLYTNREFGFYRMVTPKVTESMPVSKEKPVLPESLQKYSQHFDATGKISADTLEYRIKPLIKDDIYAEQQVFEFLETNKKYNYNVLTDWFKMQITPLNFTKPFNGSRCNYMVPLIALDAIAAKGKATASFGEILAFKVIDYSTESYYPTKINEETVRVNFKASVSGMYDDKLGSMLVVTYEEWIEETGERYQSMFELQSRIDHIMDVLDTLEWKAKAEAENQIDEAIDSIIEEYAGWAADASAYSKYSTALDLYGKCADLIDLGDTSALITSIDPKQYASYDNASSISKLISATAVFGAL